MCFSVFHGFSGFSRVFKVCQGLSRFFIVFQGFLKVFKGFQGFSRYFKGFQGISRFFKVFQVFSRFFKFFTHVDGGPSGGSSMRRPGSENPHRRERKFFCAQACRHLKTLKNIEKH